MALVCFERLAKLYPSDVRSLDLSVGENGVTPVGVIEAAAGAAPRVNVYDPLWGYFIFGQEVVFEYDESNSYKSFARFTVQGTFTKDAEYQAREAQPPSDEAAFTKLVGKFEALEAAFNAAADAEEPADFAEWGTATDARCIPLPLPLLDQDGNRVYALPESLSIEPGRWPVEVRYSATLREARFASAKLMLNGKYVDNGMINLTLPSAMISRHAMNGCSGELIQVKNYAAMEIEIAGTLPIAPGSGESTWIQPSGHMVRKAAREIVQALQADTCNVQVAVLTASGVQVRNLWQGWQRTEPSSFEMDLVRKIGTVNLRYRE